MNTIVLLGVLAVPFAVVGALTCWLTIAIGNQTSRGK
jgi:hypothetical protein